MPIITNHHQNQNLILHLDKNITHKIIILHLNHIIHKTHQQQGEVVTIHVMVKGVVEDVRTTNGNGRRNANWDNYCHSPTRQILLWSFILLISSLLTQFNAVAPTDTFTTNSIDTVSPLLDINDYIYNYRSSTIVPRNIINDLCIF